MQHAFQPIPTDFKRSITSGDSVKTKVFSCITNKRFSVKMVKFDRNHSATEAIWNEKLKRFWISYVSMDFPYENFFESSYKNRINFNQKDEEYGSHRITIPDQPAYAFTFYFLALILLYFFAVAFCTFDSVIKSENISLFVW